MDILGLNLYMVYPHFIHSEYVFDADSAFDLIIIISIGLEAREVVGSLRLVSLTQSS